MLIKEKNKKTKNNLFAVLVYFALGILVYGVSNTSIFYYGLMPFGVSVIFALLAIGYNGYYLSIVYLLSYGLAKFTIGGLIEALNVCCVLSLVMCYSARAKRNALSQWKIYVYSLLSQVLYIFLNLGSVKDNLALFVSVVLGQIFLYACLSFFVGLNVKKSFARLSLDERLCGGAVVIMVMSGLALSNVWILNCGLILAGFVILFCCYVFKFDFCVLISLLLGIGFAISKVQYSYITLFLIMYLFALMFKFRLKIFSAVSVVMGYLLYNFFFDIGIATGEFLSVVIGAVLFSCIPYKLLLKYRANNDNKKRIKYDSLFDNSRKELVKRLDELSLVFREMTSVYKSMVRGRLDDKSAMSLLKEELVSNVCNGCQNYNYCYRNINNFIDASIDDIVSVAYEKHKILLVDLPQCLTANCIKINQLVLSLNNLVGAYNTYSKSVENIDASRLLIADQLSGVSELFNAMSSELNYNMNTDIDVELLIKEATCSVGIDCYDCSVYEKDGYNKSIKLIVNNNNENDNTLLNIVNKLMKCKMEIVEKNIVNGACEYQLQTAAVYEIAIGKSVAIKYGKRQCGDTCSFAKLDGGKYIISLCDGMGSGKKARDISSLAVSLIEKFYRAGFNSEIILNSVNKLLGLSEEEIYSTIDLCVINSKEKYYDFIKLGSCDGYLIRDKGAIEIIESSNLPIGVLENIRPHISTKILNPMDMLVFVSDGVADCFSPNESLVDLLKFTDIHNPQLLSDTILNKALELSGGVANDDMSVLCVKVFEKC